MVVPRRAVRHRLRISRTEVPNYEPFLSTFQAAQGSQTRREMEPDSLTEGRGENRDQGGLVGFEHPAR